MLAFKSTDKYKGVDHYQANQDLNISKHLGLNVQVFN